jgi:hypothetical protein
MGRQRLAPLDKEELVTRLHCNSAYRAVLLVLTFNGNHRRSASSPPEGVGIRA